MVEAANVAEIARLAASHLIERGFRELAFYGEPDFNWSQWREDHFTEFARQSGCNCQVFRAASRAEKGYSWSRERRRLIGREQLTRDDVLAARRFPDAVARAAWPIMFGS